MNTHLSEGYYTHIRVLKTTRDKLGKMFPDMSYPAIIEMLIQSYEEKNK